MLSTIDEMLDTVSARQSAAGARRLADLEKVRKSGPAILHSCAASWTTRADPKKADRPGPKHVTIRRRGEAPDYPRAIDLTRGMPGKLIMLREGLALEPLDARNPCTHISAESIRRASFYGNCVEIIHSRGKRTLLRCDDALSLDLLFEAYY